MSDLAANLRRLMARHGWTVDSVVAESGLDERTIRGILAGSTRPHARTLHRLAQGLGVNSDELFQDPSLLAYRLFDRRTNPLVDEAVRQHPQLFQGWVEADFDELYSQFGAGGCLTLEGALALVARINKKRSVHDQVAVLLESSEAELLASLVDLLYQRVAVARWPDRPG